MQTGQLIPTFSLPDLHGNIWQSDMANGKVLVINFWSVECPHSQNTDALLKPYLHGWGDRVVYAASASNSNESLELMLSSAIEHQLPLVLDDRLHILADLLNAQTTPHFFVFDQTGNLSYQGGFDDTSFRQRTATKLYVVEAVNSVLDGLEPEVRETPTFGCSIVRFAEKNLSEQNSQDCGCIK
jgi:hypothetical protein